MSFKATKTIMPEAPKIESTLITENLLNRGMTSYEIPNYPDNLI